MRISSCLSRSRQDSCLAYAEAEHGDVDAVDRQLNCVDAEWQT
jgi:uncharacterized protein YecT (DUF1311 family)